VHPRNAQNDFIPKEGKMRASWIGIVICLAGIGGCSSASPDDLIKEQIRSLEEAATILEGVKDAESARAARPKLRTIIEEMQGQNARARKLAPASAEDVQELAAKHQQASRAALERLNAAARKAAEIPDCAPVVGEFNRDLDRLIR
jgi:hypothetical protein